MTGVHSQDDLPRILDSADENFRENLRAIIVDYQSRAAELSDIAATIASMIQKMHGVHSVRWRIKSPEHLATKIIRKRKNNVEKYTEIDHSNYRSIIADLIGVRAIHLYKENFPEIHEKMMSTWSLAEDPVAYIRNGDQQYLRELYDSLGISVKYHEDGYRSIHYIIQTQFTKERVLCELQVRTIFEEGWSEIDHNVRYPDFSDEPLTQEFLHIFNRLSGSADEMGSFVTRLSTAINAYKKQKDDAIEQVAEASSQLEQKINEIENMGSKNADLQAKLKELREIEEERKRRNPYRTDIDSLLSLSIARELATPPVFAPVQLPSLSSDPKKPKKS